MSLHFRIHCLGTCRQIAAIFLNQVGRCLVVGALCAHPVLSQTPNELTASDKSALVKVKLAPTQIAKSGVQATKPTRAKFAVDIKLTGRVSINEDRLAHIFPIVEGQVESVKVGLGDSVKEGDILVAVRSREVGSAKLDLFQARLALELAALRLKQQEEISTNTHELLESLRQQESITEIQNKFSGRTMGDYRDKLFSSYSSFLKSNADVDRLAEVVSSGAVSSKQLAWAKTAREADQATFLSKVEQVDYELRTSLLQARQQVKEAETRVAVTTTNLKIMGCRHEEIALIDPASQGEEISNYSIRAPLQGTVIAKDVVLREQIRPDAQIMAIADLSTVWIEANIYEKDVPLLESIKDKAITVRSAAWPNREFEAKIFYTGEIMEEATRTISMRAIATNTNKILKPGMFVNIEFQSAQSDEPVIQIPQNALLEHEGQVFVFVQTAAGEFERRNVRIGSKSTQSVVIEEGIRDDDLVVTGGGFILKSKMLESLMGEE